MLNKNKKLELVFILRIEIKKDPTVFVMKVFIAFMFIFFFFEFIDKFFFSINRFIIWGLAFLALFFFLAVFILNQIYTKKSEIGKLTLTRDEIQVDSMELEVFDILEVKKIKVNFPTQSGNIDYALGTVYFSSSADNEISFIYNGKGYHYLFVSRRAEDLDVLERIIYSWRKKGVVVDYTGPKKRI